MINWKERIPLPHLASDYGMIARGLLSLQDAMAKVDSDGNCIVFLEKFFF